MPLDFHKSTEEFQLGIWRMDESPGELDRLLPLPDVDFATITNFKSEYRKREWMTTRLLVKILLAAPSYVAIDYDLNGKPHLQNSGYSISISHTKNFVAVLLSKSAAAGIDLETIQPRIEKIAKRFVTDEENQFIEPGKELNYQHVIWGTKEVLFKIYSRGGLNFLENLHAEKFKLKDKGELTGIIEKNDIQKKYNVFYEQLNNLMLVYAMGMNDQ